MTQKAQKTLLDIVTYALLVLGAVIMVVPFLWMISTSFKLPADQFTKTLIPDPATLSKLHEIVRRGSELPSPVL